MTDCKHVQEHLTKRIIEGSPEDEKGAAQHRGFRNKNNSRQYIIVALHKEYKQEDLLNGYSVLCVSKLKFIGAQTQTMLVPDIRT
jgi:hypothetical protein